MLNELKEALRYDEERNFMMDALLENVNQAGEDIRDAFLDDPDYVVIGAENDPEIKALIDIIPEYSESDDEDVKEKVSSLVESVAATLTRVTPAQLEEMKREIFRLKSRNEKLRSEIEFFRKRGVMAQVMRAQQELAANERKIDDLEMEIRRNS